jgi:hypothetical protein
MSGRHWIRAALWAIGIVVALALVPPARAGQSCEDATLPAEEIDRAMQLAWKTRETLDASGAEVVLLARVGQDLSKYGLRFSHVAFAWRDHPAGRWTVTHLLNQCGTATSDLHDEGLANFYGIGLLSAVGGVVIPTAETQRRLAVMLKAGLHWDLHSPSYNMVAFPFSTKYQNSNQWVLETLARAIDGGDRVKDRASAQKWLKGRGYVPTTAELGTATRLGARIFRANVAFDDHPLARRLAGHIDVVSVESVFRFLTQIDPDAKQLSVTLP